VGAGTNCTLLGLDPVTAAEGRYRVQLSLTAAPGDSTGQSPPPPAVGTWAGATTPPTATIDAAFPTAVRFSEPVTGLTLADFDLMYIPARPGSDPLDLPLTALTGVPC